MPLASVRGGENQKAWHLRSGYVRIMFEQTRKRIDLEFFISHYHKINAIPKAIIMGIPNVRLSRISGIAQIQSH